MSSALCMHGLSKNKCDEDRCEHNPRNAKLVKDSLAALKTRRASFEDWVSYANFFDANLQYEKSEICSRMALFTLGGPGSKLTRVKQSVINFLKFRIKSKIYSEIPASRLSAALEDAREALEPLYNSLTAEQQASARYDFQTISKTLDEVIDKSKSSNSSQGKTIAKYFRKFTGLGEATLDLPEFAITLYEKYLAENPDDKFTKIGLAAAYNDIHKWDKAIELCRGVLRQNPKDEAARATLAKSLMHSGRAVEAWEILDITDSKRGDYAFCLSQKIICLHAMEETMAADTKMIRGIRHRLGEELRDFELSSNNPNRVQNLALHSYLDSGEVGKAWIYLEELAREGWRGNSLLWRSRIEERAANLGLDLASVVAAYGSTKKDAFTDSND